MILESQEHRRRRSNSQSQVSASSMFSGLPTAKSTLATERSKPPRRNPAEYYVTLVSLNDTFNSKYIHVPFFPDTCKLGRPTGAKVKPNSTNGYFDSRVLSRNHACMFVDPQNGKLYIQDMGSSNGTFVNLEKISAEPVQIQVGDTINLGFNIQVETNHKQISAQVDAINVMSNTPKSGVLTALPGLTQTMIDSFSDGDMKHYEFMLKFLSQIFGEEKRNESAHASPVDESSDNSITSTANMVIENAMFADLIPTMESNLYRLAPGGAGFFDNSNIVYSSELQTSLDHLTLNIMKIKQQNITLKSLETVLINYSAKVTEFNSKYLQHEMEKTIRAAEKNEKTLQADAAHSAKLLQESERKFRDQQHLVALLREEATKLRAEKEELKLQKDLDCQKKVDLLLSPQPSPQGPLPDVQSGIDKNEPETEENVLELRDSNLEEIFEELNQNSPVVGNVVEPEVSSLELNSADCAQHNEKEEDSSADIPVRGKPSSKFSFHPLLVSFGTAAVVAGLATHFYNK